MATADHLRRAKPPRLSLAIGLPLAILAGCARSNGSPTPLTIADDPHATVTTTTADADDATSGSDNEEPPSNENADTRAIAEDLLKNLPDFYYDDQLGIIWPFSPDSNLPTCDRYTRLGRGHIGRLSELDYIIEQILNLGGTRLLHKLGRDDPAAVAPLLREQLKQSLKVWPKLTNIDARSVTYIWRIEEPQQRSASSNLQILAMVATYLLAEIGDHDALPLLAQSYDQHIKWIGDEKRNITPVPVAITLYAMHRLIETYPEGKLTPETKDLREDYLAWTSTALRPIDRVTLILPRYQPTGGRDDPSADPNDSPTNDSTASHTADAFDKIRMTAYPSWFRGRFGAIQQNNNGDLAPSNMAIEWHKEIMIVVNAINENE